MTFQAPRAIECNTSGAPRPRQKPQLRSASKKRKSSMTRSPTGCLSATATTTAQARPYAKPTLGAGLSHTGSLCRQSLRNTRSSAEPRPAPPIASCSTQAQRRKTRRGSNRPWMKVHWQVITPSGRRWSRIVLATPAIRGAAAGTTDCLCRRCCGLLTRAARGLTCQPHSSICFAAMIHLAAAVINFR